jgi:peptidoglycan-associated lipoprotein
LNAEQRIAIAVVALLVSAGMVTSCAKRPSVTAAVAPAPTAAPLAPAAPPAVAPPPAPAVAPPPAPAVAPAMPAPLAPPAPPVAKPAEFAPTPGLLAIHFDFDKFDIRAKDAKILDDNASWLRAHPQHIVLVEGHCDERGTNEYNLALGDRRARTTRDYLVARGIAASRILIVSYGEERPQCTDRNEKCWAQNRAARFLTKAQ